MVEIMTIDGLGDDEQRTLNGLIEQLNAHAARNLLRDAYYDGRNAIRDLGISIPPNLRRVAMVLGWSAKAVDILNRRCNLEGFFIPGLDPSSLGVNDLWDANQLDLESAQAGASSLIHATAFLVTSAGDESVGEPPVIIMGRDALSATGSWDRRARHLDAFLSVLGTDDDDYPTDLALYLPNVVISLRRDKGTTNWDIDRQQHRYGVPVEPLPYRPRLGRPFGSSRISRAVMSLHDSAIRTIMRSEVTAELYSVPQRMLLGVDESAFIDADGNRRSMWQSLLGRIWALERDEDGQIPEVKEFSSATQTPHVDQLRAWAQLFAGETSIPISSLGISTDANPASAEAYYASREDLITEAEGTTDGWSPAWRRSMQTALAMLNGWSTIPDEVKALQPRWRSPATPSRAAAADAASKTLDKFPWLAESELGLELYGFDRSFIIRAMAELRRRRGRSIIDQIMADDGAILGEEPVVAEPPIDELPQ